MKKTQNASNSPSRVALVTGSLAVGGSTTFLCNLGGEMVRRNLSVEVLCFEEEHPLALDFDRLGIPVWSIDNQCLIFEDRMMSMLRRLSERRSDVVLANLGTESFEVLRYLPPGVFRVGVAHADDPNVYGMLRNYAPHLDLLAVVSETIQRKMEALPEFANTPVRYLPLGVPMPAHG